MRSRKKKNTKIKKLVKKTIKKPKKVLVKKKPINKSPKRKKPKKSVPENTFPAESFFKAKIKVIGIGGGGGSIVSEIGRSLHKATFVIADTDARAFKKRKGIKYFLFGQGLTHGLGTGLNTDLAKLAAEQEKERISHFFEDQDIVIFVASLGGGLGSGATQIFLEVANNFNGITFGIFTLPFKFEGNNKYKIALKSLRELRKSLNVSITIPNERIFKVIDNNTAITDAFSIVNKNLIGSLESLIDLIYNPGIINIDFADLRAILSGRGNLAFLNTAEAHGKGRALDIVQKILHNPLYQNNNFTAQKIIFNITGGNNLGMSEVDKISRTISQLNPKAKIIFGISKNSKYKNKIKTTLLMTGNSTESKLEKSKSIPPKNKKSKKKVKDAKGKIPPIVPFSVFEDISLANQPSESGVKKLSIIEASTRLQPQDFNTSLFKRENQKPITLSVQKKAIRRTALEIKKAEDAMENEQSTQEKEWEIPAFLRKVKFK